MNEYSFDDAAPARTSSVTEFQGDPRKAFGFDEDEFEPANDAPAPTRSGAPNLLESLRKELSKPLNIPDNVVVPVKGRPGLAVRFSTDLSIPAYNKWQKQSTEGSGRKATVNQIDLMSRIIIGQSICLVLNGQDVRNSEGNPMGLRDPELADLIGAVGGPLSVVETLYGRDMNILQAGLEVLTACGMGDDEDEDELDEDDPKD